MLWKLLGTEQYVLPCTTLHPDLKATCYLKKQLGKRCSQSCTAHTQSYALAQSAEPKKRSTQMAYTSAGAFSLLAEANPRLSLRITGETEIVKAESLSISEK